MIHRAALQADADYTIIQRYQAVVQGLYNYYCMAVNVGNRARMGRLRWVLEMSLTKTLAHKHQCSVTSIYRKYKVVETGHTMLRAEIERPGKKPLVATFGGFPRKRKPKGLGVRGLRRKMAWNAPGDIRTEVVQRLLAEVCEVCGASGPVQMHHLRKLADIDRPGRRPKEIWEHIMAGRKRKTLVVCKQCHHDIHAGRHDGPKL